MDTQQDHRIDKALVTSALEHLGAERVMRGHVALEHGTPGDWYNCFLAMCYGGYGLLVRQSTDLDSAAVGRALGLTTYEVVAVSEAFDHCRAEFQVLVEEWLELNYRLPTQTFLFDQPRWQWPIPTNMGKPGVLMHGNPCVVRLW